MDRVTIGARDLVSKVIHLFLQWLKLSVGGSAPRRRLMGWLSRRLNARFPTFTPVARSSLLDRPEPTAALPPQYPWAEDLHRQQLADLSSVGDLDILLVGDSLAQHWPLEIWRPWRARSLGVGGDRTQHVLWRLNQVEPGAGQPIHVLVVAGTNNLLAGDGAVDIATGIAAIVGKVASLYPDASVSVLLPPPLGPGFQAAVAQRRGLKRLLAASPGYRVIDADAALIADGRDPNPHFEPDLVHLTNQGYDVLTATVRAAAQ